MNDTDCKLKAGRPRRRLARRRQTWGQFISQFIIWLHITVLLRIAVNSFYFSYLILQKDNLSEVSETM